ncbi:MAG: lipid-A-disaccharide synthase [Vicinamibacterales bacterium]|nr:lipid-A-disaccharide synthase [Vicinamibacterales bacterium]
MARVMVSCGEASGDLYAGALTAELKRLDPSVEVFGFGGGRLAAAGADLVGDFRGHTVTGLVEVLEQLPRTYAMYRRLVAAARERRPDVLVTIDYPDFNFTLGKALHRLGVPVVYYISPQLWAWRQGRMKAMKRFVDRVLTIFPFEAPIYERAGVPVEFVGHPLVDLIPAPASRTDFLGALGLDPAAPTVALLPGSRPNELHQILPTIVEACPLVASAVPRAQFVVARAPGLDQHLFDPLARLRDGGGRCVVVEHRTDDVLACADAAITASGTATVQAALHGCPMVIVYRLSPLTYRLGIRFVRVDTYGMVNLVAGRRVVTELIQDGFTAEATARECVALLADPVRAAQVRADLADVRRRLGGGGASGRAAAAVLAAARGTGAGANASE